MKCVYVVNPFRLNQRLTVQKGAFFCPGDVSVSFEDNLKVMRDYKDHVVKLVLPASEVESGLSTLFNMNIGDATLFPDLDGFARSLAVYLPFFPAPSEHDEGF